MLLAPKNHNCSSLGSENMDLTGHYKDRHHRKVKTSAKIHNGEYSRHFEQDVVKGVVKEAELR